MATHHRDEVGMVTAETALVMPIIAAFALAMLWLVTVAITEVRLVDASRDAARALARGEDLAVVEAQVARDAPRGAHLAVTRIAGELTAELTMTAQPPGWLFVPLPGVPLHAAATTQTETAADALR